MDAKPATDSPANSRQVTAENRIPMSVPNAKLSAPEIAGFFLYWMRGEESRVVQAMKAGYTYVTQEDLDSVGDTTRSTNVAGDAAAAGSTDLGSRITVLSNQETDAVGRPVRMVLMKLPNAWREQDKKAQEEVQDRLVAALRSTQSVEAAVAAKQGMDLSRRYTGTSNANIFTKRRPSNG